MTCTRVLAGLLLALLMFGRAEAGQFVQFKSGETTLTAYMAKPGIGGRHPAVVLLHSSPGFHASMLSWADRLSHWGYVALAVDSFGSRGIERGTGSGGEQAKDAFAALHFLTEQAFVRADSIAVMGFSLGGNATLVLAGLDQDSGGAPHSDKFRAAVAFYPDCSGSSRPLNMPILILVGELDDWTPAKACEALAGGNHGDSGKVKLVVYPGARHAFDVVELDEVPGGITVVGHRMEYNVAATKDAAVKVHEFLKRELSD